MRAARLLPWLGLAAMLAGCERPPNSAYVPVASGGSGGQIVVGRTAAGEECRMSPVGGGGDIWCGDWQSPSARIRLSRAGTALAAAASAREGATGQLDCAPPRPTTALGGQEAAIMDCRRRAGNWPAFALTVASGGRVWQAEGVLPALPAAERAIGVLSGRETAEAAPLPSGAIDLLATRLAREAFATGDIGRFEALMAVGRDANQAERFVAAETAYRAALALQERVLGANSPGSFSPLLFLALQLSNQTRYPEADALFARAAVLAPRAADPLAPAMLAHYRALHEANRGHTDAALAGLAEGGRRYAALLPPELRSGGARTIPAAPVYDPITARALVGLVETRRNSAAVLRAAGRNAEAATAAAEAGSFAAAAPSIAGTDLIAARLQRTAGATAASSGAGASAERSFASAAGRFARGVPRSRPYAETLLLRVEQLGGDPAAAAVACREAVAVLRSLREGVSANRIAPCVDVFVALAQAQPSADQALLGEAFEAAQLAQGNVTTTQIAAAAARLAASARNPAVGSALRQRDDTGRAVSVLYRDRDAAVAAGRPTAELTAIDGRIAAAETAAADADAAVQTAAPGFAQLVQSVVSGADAMAALQLGEALVMSSLPPAHHGWTFVLLDGRLNAGRVAADGAAVAALVRTIRASVESGGPEKPFEAGAAHALYRALFAEVAEPLGRARSMVAVPEGPLLSLPYGLLVTAPPPRAQSHEGAEFLLSRLPVAYVPAPASLVELRRTGRSRAPNPWFGFGAPRPISAAYAARSFPAAPGCGRLLAGLPALPAAAIELQAAAQASGAAAADRDIGAAFTVDAVRQANLRNYRVVHFATHGVLPSELACLTEPTIIASTSPRGPSAEEALLTSGTVLNLDLDADLVLLSACNSGGGAAAGESLSTLARAFFFAGARALMVTHWYVNDSAAARVGIFTLRYMRAGDPPALALQKAQLGVLQLRGGGHPAFWAPFALIGPGPAAAAPPRSAAAAPGTG